MEFDNIECVSSLDGMDEDEMVSQSPSFLIKKPQGNVNVLLSHPTTSVHELLECPVCTNSMYPPIHQV